MALDTRGARVNESLSRSALFERMEADMAFLAMAMPIPPGKMEQWKKFSSELKGARKAEFSASRKKAGVRERTFLQKTPMGDLIIVTLEGDDPVGFFQKFSASDDPFAKWFVAQASEIHGVDLSKPPPGPMPELVIDSQG
jgi:hypothetical protein